MATKQAPIMIPRGTLMGTIEAVPGVRVALMVPGEKRGYRCFEERRTGTITRVTEAPWPDIIIDLDEPLFNGSPTFAMPAHWRALTALADQP